ISRRMRAMAALSKPQPFRLDAILEDLGAAGRQRRRDGRLRSRRSVAEETPAAARATNFRRRRARGRGAGDEIVDRRGGDAGRELLPVLPFPGDLAADLVPIAADERLAHRRGRVAYLLEALEDLAVAVDVRLHDLPVVGSRMPRCARVDQHDSAFEL